MKTYIVLLIIIFAAPITISLINLSKKIAPYITNNTMKPPDTLFPTATSDHSQKEILKNSWNYYKEHYIEPDGRVIDPARNNGTTSEGQSYALLRAVYMDDKELFNTVWQWTKENLQKRKTDNLFAWLYENNRVADSQAATDADVDIALSLLFASSQWNSQEYKTSAVEIISDIWDYEVVKIQGLYGLGASPNSLRTNGYLLNPSYFSPAHYRIFAEVDKENPWMQLADDSYILLSRISNSANINNTESKLPPNWVIINHESGDVRIANDHTGSSGNQFGYDAFRTMWRVALDSQWFETKEAYDFLLKSEPFFKKKFESRSLASVYNLDGSNAVDYNNISTDTAPLSVFTVTDYGYAQKFYDRQYKSRYDEEGFWIHKNNYYDQNWAWFATALYSGNFPSLW